MKKPSKAVAGTVAANVRLSAQFVFTRNRLVELHQYADEIERMLAREAKHLKERVRGQSMLIEPHQVHEYLEDMMEDVLQIDETFPRIFRYSLFAQCASDFEHMVLTIAKTVGGIEKVELTLADLKDEGIRKARTYIKKVARRPFPDTIAEWGDAISLSAIRNIIIHNGGRISSDHPRRKEILRFVKQWAADIKIDQHGQFSFSPMFVGRVIENYAVFFEMLKRSLK